MGSFDYMKEDNIFPQKEISYIFQNYQPAQYQQTNSETFMSHLSVIDCLFQHGPKETRNIIDKARGIYYSVEELERQKNG